MVYYDANKLVLLEYSFPARSIVNDIIMTSKFKYNSDDNIITNKELLSIIIYIYGNITNKMLL